MHCWLAYTNNANFRNDYPGSSEISTWALSTDCGGPHGAFEWLFLAGILELSLDCSKAVYFAIINGWFRVSKESNYFRLSAQREDLRWSRLFEYTPHLVSTSRPFWEYCWEWLFIRTIFLGRQEQPLAAQYLNWNLFRFWWRTLYIAEKL